MLTSNTQRLLVLTATASACIFAASESTTTAPVTVAVQKGTAAFSAATNIPAVIIKGKSAALEAHASIRRKGDGLELEHIEARVPVKTLLTGMAVRDEHMRKYIFTTSDGQTPDLQFEADKAECTGAGKEETCQVAGTLSIRGVSKPFTLPLKIRDEGASYKATADTIVKLSVWGIPQPSQFGVKTTDDVQLHFEFVGHAAASAETASLGGHQ